MQRTAESQSLEIRETLRKYDSVVEHHRREAYGSRREISCRRTGVSARCCQKNNRLNWSKPRAATSLEKSGRWPVPAIIDDLWADYLANVADLKRRHSLSLLGGGNATLDNGVGGVIISSVSTVDNQRERLEFLQGTLEVLILRSLRPGPNHAYGISLFLKQQSGNEFLVDNGSLYPALQRLLQREWIAAQWKTSPNGRRAKYYRLTPLGRKQLAAATSKWLRFVEAMGRILAPEG